MTYFRGFWAPVCLFNSYGSNNATEFGCGWADGGGGALRRRSRNVDGGSQKHIILQNDAGALAAGRLEGPIQGHKGES